MIEVSIVPGPRGRRGSCTSVVYIPLFWVPVIWGWKPTGSASAFSFQPAHAAIHSLWVPWSPWPRFFSDPLHVRFPTSDIWISRSVFQSFSPTKIPPRQHEERHAKINKYVFLKQKKVIKQKAADEKRRNSGGSGGEPRAPLVRGTH